MREKGSGAGMHFRGANQPGRRAVLEETNSTSDLFYYTANDLFSQAQTNPPSIHIAIIFNKMGYAGLQTSLRRTEVLPETFDRYSLVKILSLKSAWANNVAEMVGLFGGGRIWPADCSFFNSRRMRKNTAIIRDVYNTFHFDVKK